MNKLDTYLLSKIKEPTYIKEIENPNNYAIYAVDDKIETPLITNISITTLFIMLIIGFTTFIIKAKNKLINKVIYSILFISTLIIIGFLIFKPEFFNLETNLVGKIILSSCTFLTNIALLVKFRKDKFSRIIFLILLLITIILQFFL